MQISNNEFTGLRKQLILPLFKGAEKPPNNSLAGLSRVQKGTSQRGIGLRWLRREEGQENVTVDS